MRETDADDQSSHVQQQVHPAHMNPVGAQVTPDLALFDQILLVAQVIRP
jgi:hypothetical protein